MLSYDALNMKFREFKLRKDPNTQPITKLIDYQQFCGLGLQEENNERFARISVQEAKSKLDSGWQPFVLDVRKPHELAIVSLDFVDLSHPHDTILDILDQLPGDQDILIHCKKGGRSAKACQALQDAGLERLFNLEGGITDWAQQIDTSLPTY